MSQESVTREFVDDPLGQASVRGFLHTPERPSGDGLILTHGAGGNCEAPLLVALADLFCNSGITVLRCDLPFRQSRPHGPPTRGSAERDQQGLRRAVEALRKRVSGRVFLGGHSYGGRQASMLLASKPGIAHGLLLLSYPLHPPNHPEQLRTSHFGRLRTPALFVHGTRDTFGKIEEMTEAIKLIAARTKLFAVEHAGHQLSTKNNKESLPGKITGEFAGFFQSVVAPHSSTTGLGKVELN